MTDNRPPLTTTTSIKPALTVLLIAVGMLAVFLGINIVTDQTVTHTTTTTEPIVVGGLSASTSTSLLDPCLAPSVIPTNISSDLSYPAGSTSAVSLSVVNSGAGDFDCIGRLSTSGAPAALLAYYQHRLEPLGWSLFSQGSVSGQPQSLFQKAGSDGFYWIMGVTVESHRAGQMVWQFRLYQNSEVI
jgi:hypothetical protein